MTSVRRARVRVGRWFRYYRHYPVSEAWVRDQPWWPPAERGAGLSRAVDRLVLARITAARRTWARNAVRSDLDNVGANGQHAHNHE